MQVYEERWRTIDSQCPVLLNSKGVMAIGPSSEWPLNDALSKVTLDQTCRCKRKVLIPLSTLCHGETNPSSGIVLKGEIDDVMYTVHFTI